MNTLLISICKKKKKTHITPIPIVNYLGEILNYKITKSTPSLTSRG